MITLNITNPGQTPVDGDLIRVTQDNGTTEQYTYYTPVPVLAPQPIASCPAIEFLMRFTSSERIAVRTSTNAAVKDWMTLMDDPRLLNVHFNLARPAIDMLVQLSILTQQRADEICPVI